MSVLYPLFTLIRKSPHGGQPEELTETDFDIIAPFSASNCTVYITEMIKSMVEVMDSFEEQLGPYYIRVRFFSSTAFCFLLSKKEKEKKINEK